MKMLCMTIRLKMSSDKAKKRMPKWLDVTLRVIEWTLILFIVGCMLALLAQTMTGKTPELFGYSTYTVVTDSMEGTYDVGDVVLCKRIKDTLKYQEDTGFKEGEVIAFIAPANFDKNNVLKGYTVTHRIITAPYYDEEKKRWYVETKGDAAFMPDNVPIPLENIQGIIVGSNKFITNVFGFIGKWYGFVVVIVIPLLAILIWQVIVLAKGRSKEKLEMLSQEKAKTLKEIEDEHNQMVEEIKRKAIEDYKNGLKETKEEK